MWYFLTHLFDTTGFMPRWNCGLWTDGHGWLHILSDIATWGAYTAIPIVLAFFVLRRRDIPFSRVFLLFGVFILACGTVHLVEATIFWYPWYRLSGLVKLGTAIVSWGTVIALVQVTPKALALPGLAKVNSDLQAENLERRRAERQLADFFENAIVGLHWLAQDGTVLRANRAELELLGLESHEYVGRNIRDFFTDRSVAEQMLHRLMIDEPVHNLLAQLRCKDGSVKDVLISSNVLREDGRFIHSRGFTRDVTDIKRAQEALVTQARELEESNAQLMRSNHDLDEFAYIASHDLREPLRGIHNYATFLGEDFGDKLDDDGRAKLQSVQRLSTRMDALLDGLMEYSRVGRGDLAFQPTNLNKVLVDVLDDLKPMLEANRAEVHITSAMPMLVCDRVRIGEVFSNLIGNAVKYNDNSIKRIEIGLIKSNGDDNNGCVPKASPTFFVRDNGIGIDERHHQTIFRIFKRLHGRDKFGGGTGAGLTIVQKIIERHEGRIWLESMPGQGTTFFFTIPQES